jgi:hypothetical protein
MAIDLAALEKCDGLLVIGEMSTGIAQEMAFARKIGMTMCHLSIDGNLEDRLSRITFCVKGWVDLLSAF